MKKLIGSGVATVLALSAILTGCGGTNPASQATTNPVPASEATAKPADEKPIELKMGHVLSPDSHFHALATKFAKLAAQKSNGAIKITIFPQSQLGGDVRMIQSMRTGIQGLSITASSILVNTIPEYMIFDLPYLFDSIDQGNEVLSGPVGKKYLDMLEKHDLVGLGFLSVLERNVFSNKAIQSADDINSLKLRIMQAPGHVKSYEALGAQPTPMAYSEVYMSLQQGVIDGGDTTPDQFIMDKFMEVAKNYNLTKVHYLPLVLTMSKVVWDQMSPNQQKILQEAADEALAYQIDYYKNEYARSIEAIKQAGVSVVESDVEDLKKKAITSYDAILKDIPNGKQLLEEIQAAKK
ncbi:TRAP transporter substrate-binding protein [Ammoniphilus resinae]|nr:TRAP transporter substrate-binding protein [Ammoniphilus resinae]